MTTKLWLLAIGAWPLFLACGSGEEGARPGDASSWTYTKTCALTACEACEDSRASNCSECNGICSQPGSYSGCYADCDKLCRLTCSACSRPESCKEWKFELPPPGLDQALYDVCLQVRERCTPTDFDQGYCDYIARTRLHTEVEQYQCVQQRGCDASEACFPALAIGTLGTSFCERAAACGKPCAEKRAEFLNGNQNGLRPELVRALRQCIAEPQCEDFNGCAGAFEELWQLPSKKADPGSPLRCSGNWMSYCDGACECGFSCFPRMPGFPPTCGVPCSTDADCIGTSTGLSATPHCQVHGGLPGLCVFVD